MLYRRKVFLNLVAKSVEPLSLIKLHKLMFLFVKATDTNLYSFIPNRFGCYSLTLHDDQVALIKKRLLVEEKRDSPFTSYVLMGSTYCDDATIVLQKEDSEILDFILLQYQKKTGNELIALTYRMDPFYSIRSQIIENFADENDFLHSVNTIKKNIQHAPRGLYTIGYEGFSIDGFIQLLLCSNISCLVDVRKIAFSMRREFCKTNLQNALCEAGIRYVRMPEVGIPSKKRKEMVPLGKKDALFAWYQDAILPNCAAQASDIAGLVSKENIAIMCYEKDPNDCHRSLFATYCKVQQPSIPAILHMRGDPSVKESLNYSAYLSDTIV